MSSVIDILQNDVLCFLVSFKHLSFRDTPSRLLHVQIAQSRQMSQFALHYRKSVSCCWRGDSRVISAQACVESGIH